MHISDRTLERIRWRCRRGMLELDLVLDGFLNRHLESLDAARLETLKALLTRTDPELLDLVMGRSRGRNREERELLALIDSESIERSATCSATGF